MKKKDQSVIGCIFSYDRASILLVKRRDVPVWTLPGGGKEEGETLEEAMVRELKEETGYNVKLVRLVGQYLPINRLSKETFLYEAKIISGSPMVGHETKELKFFSLSALPKHMPVPYGEWIDDAINPLSPMVFRYLESVNYTTLIKTFVRHPILVSRFLLARLGIFINS